VRLHDIGEGRPKTRWLRSDLGGNLKVEGRAVDQYCSWMFYLRARSPQPRRMIESTPRAGILQVKTKLNAAGAAQLTAPEHTMITAEFDPKRLPGLLVGFGLVSASCRKSARLSPVLEVLAGNGNGAETMGDVQSEAGRMCG